MIIDPLADITEDALEECGVEVGFICQREIKLIGETIGPKEARLQIRSALEDPNFFDLVVRLDA